MGNFVDTNFEADAINSTPAGFYTFNLGGSVQHGGDLNPASAGGDHCFQFSASGGLGVGPVQGLSVQTSITINFSLKNLLNAGLSTSLVGINSRDAFNANGAQIALVGYNSDGTFFIQSGSILVCTSVDTYELDEWMYIQVDIVFGLTRIMGVDIITVTADLLLNGKKIADSFGAITSSLPASVCPLGPGANDYEFSPPGFLGGLIDNITISTPSQAGAPYYPHGGFQSARMTQNVVEVIEVPDNAKLRLTQGVAEVLEVPSNSFLRFTQGVIELITVGDTGGDGWKIYEA